MIYTIGHTESYTKYFEEQHPEGPLKKGRTADYTGGSVWKTAEEAANNCPPGYSVYGVEADWDKDTILSTLGDRHDLLVDSKLVNIDTDKTNAAQEVNRDEMLKELIKVLDFYGDPDTYFAIGFFPDHPCGELMEDFDEYKKPGARARKLFLKYGKEIEKIIEEGLHAGED